MPIKYAIFTAKQIIKSAKCCKMTSCSEASRIVSFFGCLLFVVVMLPKNFVKSLWHSSVKATSFSALPITLVARAQPRTIPAPRPSLCGPASSFTLFGAVENPADKVMPTPVLQPKPLEKVDCGTGQPAQRGHRKPLVWKRRQPWFDRQWSLDLKRKMAAPATPYFPDGVPFTQIRKFQSFAGRSFKVNAGRRRKVRMSLKRGRRKLL